MHADQLQIDVDVVRGLLRAQFPSWSELPIAGLTTAATVHAIFRLGDGLAARFPLQGADPVRVRRLLELEMQAASEFAKLSPVAAPEPLALGKPGLGYPLPWTVQTWVPGHDAVSEDPGASQAFADDLAGLIARLRSVDTHGRHFNGLGRGGHLPDHDDWVSHCFEKSEGIVDVPSLRALWDEWRTLPEVDADVMSHGDLTPPNVLVSRGRLVGVLDTGGFAPADPALDLVSAWHLLDRPQRERVRERLGCSEVQWMRGAAWALQQALGLVWYYADSNPVMSRWGLRTLDRLLVDYQGR
jgi:aminoglycoside phosphotransferase (APT) family kinase protein